MTLQDSAAAITVNGIKVQAIEKGRGRPLLFLHPGIGLDRNAPVINMLAERARVIAPSHPGFGNSEQPRSFTTIDDLAYFYLDLLDELDLKDTVVVGVSLGAWIAAEIAIKSTGRLSHLVLANAVGIKVGARDTRDIVDIFAITEPELNKLAYFDPKLAERDYKAMAEEDVRIVARNREASARYGWSPYMHDPKLKTRLHRIRIPTLFLWGSADRILTEN
jgi:pimeloyl-ACP methyl ester carboxylesterase